jgi:hypothetical protein
MQRRIRSLIKSRWKKARPAWISHSLHFLFYFLIPRNSQCTFYRNFWEHLSWMCNRPGLILVQFTGVERSSNNPVRYYIRLPLVCFVVNSGRRRFPSLVDDFTGLRSIICSSPVLPRATYFTSVHCSIQRLDLIATKSDILFAIFNPRKDFIPPPPPTHCCPLPLSSQRLVHRTILLVRPPANS